MYTSILSSLTVLVGTFTLAIGGPVPQSQTPYFAIRSFTLSKSTPSSRYSLNISFPQEAIVSDPKNRDTTYTIPGFTDPVACTGTYFYSPSETSTVTLINACGYIGDGSQQRVTTKLDVQKGELLLTYSYNTTADGQESVFVWSGKQTGLSPVGADAMEGFNTPATGPAVGA